jgi:hypothetical protein
VRLVDHEDDTLDVLGDGSVMAASRSIFPLPIPVAGRYAEGGGELRCGFGLSSARRASR